jgi:hypothetical protein
LIGSVHAFQISRVPEGFYFDRVKISDVPKINSVWAQRSTRSLEYLTKMITLNPSTGLYSSDTGQLVAWCLMLETGAMGNLQVDRGSYRKGLGELTFKKQALKMGKELNRELCGFVAHHNAISLKMCTKVGFEVTANKSFIGVKRKETPPKLTPFWGRI